MTYRTILALCAVAPAACVPGLDVPDGTEVECGPADECPSGWTCNPDLGWCVLDTSNRAPSVEIDPIAHTTGTVTVRVTVIDPESDEVVLAGAIGPEQAVSLVPARVTGSPEGTAHDLAWDAAAFFGDSGFRGDLELTITPNDASNLGPAETSAPFAFGNDEPELLSIEVEGAELGAVSGVLQLSLRVEDNAADSLSLVALDFSATGEFDAVNTVSVPLASDVIGPYLDLATDELGGTVGIAWRSGGAANLYSDAAVVRARLRDGFGIETATVESAPFTLDNRPSFSFGVVAPGAGERFINTVAVPFIVDDPNELDSLDVRFEYGIPSPTGGIDWYVATADATSDPLTDLTEFGPSAPHLFVWDALADATTATKGLSANTLPTSADDSTSEPTVAHQPTIYLQAVVVDRSTIELAPVELAETIPLGNEPPEIQLATPAELGAGMMPIAFTVGDSAGDEAAVEICFALFDAAAGTYGPCEAITVGQGSLGGVTSDVLPAVAEHVVTWNSTAAAPGGIGETTELDLLLRARASDAPAFGVRYYGGWSEVTLAELRNQSPPRVVELRGVRAETVGGVSRIPLTFKVVDEQSDPVDLRCDLSFDLGGSWQPCVENKRAISEGRYDLTSSPAGFDGSGGVLHTFVLDPAGLRLGPEDNTWVRLRASDGRSPTFGEATTALAAPASPIPLEADPSAWPQPLAGNLGGFVISQEFVFTNDAEEVGVLDLNGDGILDIASAVRTNPGWVATYLGQGSDGVGNGYFTWVADNPAGNGPFNLAVGHFDGDALEDVAVVNLDGHGLTILRSVGDGTLTAMQTFGGLGNQPRDMDVADFNNDGRLDIVTANGNTFNWSVFLNDPTGTAGTGVFTRAVDVPGDSGMTVGMVSAADIDEDGDVDIIGDTGTGLSIFSNDGAANFPDRQDLEGVWLSEALLVADLDGDGHLDIAGGTGNLGLIRILFGDGALNFREEAYDVGSGLFELSRADVNQDGLLDLIASDTQDGDLPMLVRLPPGGGGDRTFAEPAFLDVGGGPRAFARGDFNGDGQDDIAVNRRDYSGVRSLFVLLSSPLREIDPRSWAHISSLPLADLTEILTTVDLDANGAVDIVAGSGDAHVEIFPGLSVGPVATASFGEPVRIDVGGKASGFVHADLDADGWVDLIIADASNDRLLRLRGAPGGIDSATPLTVVAAGVPSPAGMLARDLNGDGAVDLVVESRVCFGDVHVFFGQLTGGLPTGDLVEAAVVPTGGIPSGLASGDFDEDGITDLFIGQMAYDSDDGVWCNGADEGTDDFELHLGLPGWTATEAFFSTPTYASNHRPRELRATDFDLDGHLDVVVATGFGMNSFVGFLRGNGAGGLTEVEFRDTAAHPQALILDDVTGDGIIDLVAGGTDYEVSFHGGSGAHGVASAVWDRDAQGGWASPTEYRYPDVPLGTSRVPFAYADLNHDGVEDVISGANWTSVQDYQLKISLGRTCEFRACNTRAVEPCGPTLARGVQLFGGEADPSELDRFGDPRPALDHLTVSREITTAHGPDLNHHPTLRASHPELPPGLEPLTLPRRFGGDRRLARGPMGDGAAEGYRLRVEHRIGPRRVPGSKTELDRRGLDLTPQPGEEQRGVIIELPIRHDLTDADILAGEVRLFVGTEDWRRASDDVADPTHPYLRCALDVTGLCERSLIQPTVQWAELSETTDPTFASGEGPRFFVNLDDPHDRVVRVLTDRLGVFEGYLLAP